MNVISLPMQVPEGALDVVMAGLAATGNVDGLSLTMPHKIAGFAHCRTVTETARMLGVVSALRRNKDGSWHGHTTDGDAFVIRVYEVEGRDTENVALDLPFAAAAAEEIDFLELEVLGPVQCEGRRLTFAIGHDEIKAIRVFPAGDD